MAGTDAMGGLRAWRLATFRATSFLTAAVVTFHLRGSLATFLHRFDTAIGFAFFVAFWLVTWIATRIGLRLADEHAPAEDVSPDAALPSTIVAGGWNGVFVFAMLLIGILATFVQAQGPSSIRVLPLLVFAWVLGGLLAFTIGGIAGFAYGLVDAFVGLIGRALFGWVVRTGGGSRCS